jgi:5-methylcytosine-specific restriction endonuclease McrA
LSKHRKKHKLLIGKNNPAFIGGPVSLICAVCNKSFVRKRSQYNPDYKKQYCSKKCQYKGLTLFYSRQDSPHAGKWTTRPCDSCGKQLTRPVGEFREMAFCNSQCFANWKSVNWTGKDAPGWNGGYEGNYGKNWKRQARRTRARDKHKCQRCGITEVKLGRALDVHHIIRFKSFYGDWKKANQLKNLISYCHSCHMLIEHSSIDN